MFFFTQGTGGWYAGSLPTSVRVHVMGNALGVVGHPASGSLFVQTDPLAVGVIAHDTFKGTQNAEEV